MRTEFFGGVLRYDNSEKRTVPYLQWQQTNKQTNKQTNRQIMGFTTFRLWNAKPSLEDKTYVFFLLMTDHLKKKKETVSRGHSHPASFASFSFCHSSTVKPKSYQRQGQPRKTEN